MKRPYNKCLNCHFDKIDGIYSAIEPHQWIWFSSGNASPDDYEILYCPNCGIKLPHYGTLSKDDFDVWYDERIKKAYL